MRLTSPVDSTRPPARRAQRPRPAARGLALAPRLVKFGAVGLSGVGVNLVVVWVSFEFLLRDLAQRPRLALAFAAGIAVSIATNFVLNDRWTWRDRRSEATGAIGRFLRFATVSLAAAALQFGIAMGVAVGLGWSYLLAQTLGIGIGSAVNFATNDLWTFGHGNRQRTVRIDA